MSGIAAALQEMGPGETTDTPFWVVVRRSFGDRAFRGFTRAGSLLVLVLFGAAPSYRSRRLRRVAATWVVTITLLFAARTSLSIA